MAPSNFRTYEAQSRLLAAVIASSPALRLNFKDIAKYYGESTPMGIEFQFRSIRKEAKALRDAVDRGESPLSTRGPGASPTVRKRRTPAASSSALSTPRKRARTADTLASNEEGSVTSEANYDDLDLTPRTTFARDATPSLSVSATPTDASSEAAADEFYTAPRTQSRYRPRQQQSDAHQATIATYSMANFVDDDDDDDDDVFIVDTPSKVPKVEPVSASAGPSVPFVPAMPADIKPRALSPPRPQMAGSHTANINDLDGYSSRDTLSQDQSQSQTAFSYSSDAWTQPDFFDTTETGSSFAQATSFYDDDAAI